MNLLRILLLSIPIILTGCFSDHPPLPEDWGKTAQTNNCPSFEGYYFSQGEGADDIGIVPSLYKVLINAPLNIHRIEYIRITQKKDSLIIQAFSDDTLREEKEIPLKTSNCINGFLQLDTHSKKDGINRDGVLGYEWNTLLLSKASDGALIVRRDSGGVGVVLLIPVAGSAHQWYRYPKIQK